MTVNRLKSRAVFPKGGWQFRLVETGWKLPNPMEVSFNQSVETIIRHLVANPHVPLPHDFNSVANLLEDYTCARDPGACREFSPEISVIYVKPRPSGSCRTCG